MAWIHENLFLVVQDAKFVTITTSGAPAETFADVTDYLKHRLGMSGLIPERVDNAATFRSHNYGSLLFHVE